MLDMPWLDSRLVPGGSVEGAITLANRLDWDLRWEVRRGTWRIMAGRAVLLRTDSRQVAEAFLYGLGLAYGVLPSEVLDQLESHLRALGDLNRAASPGQSPGDARSVPITPWAATGDRRVTQQYVAPVPRGRCGDWSV